MKVSVARMALIALLTVSMGHVQAYTDCLDRDMMARRCPCNKPKPAAKPKPTTKPSARKVEDGQPVNVMSEGCTTRPNLRPRPGQKPNPRMNPVMVNPEMTKGCPCNKPKPKPIASPSKAVNMRTFNAASPAEQRTKLAAMVEVYMASPCAESMEMLKMCSMSYCTRVKSQAMNKLVAELETASNKKAVQAKIVRTLEV